MYSLVRPILFQMPPERSHELALMALKAMPRTFFSVPKVAPVEALGMVFSHPVGLAAGLDKNAEYLDALAKVGFSHIEVGTVTPKPQAGNPKPRLFRLPKARAIINRMGFNNHGVDALVQNIQKAEYDGILGVNIGKNKATPLSQATEDYLHCLSKVYPYASYITINISSPNTPDLRQLQQKEYFTKLLAELKKEQMMLSDKFTRYVPLVVKVSPDETKNALQEMAEIVLSQQMDGIIATNTTCSRSQIEKIAFANEAGGLSGAPLMSRSTECLKILKEVVGDSVALIGVGGIDSPSCARQKLEAGANLLQIYTGLIYEGPWLVNRIVDELSQ